MRTCALCVFVCCRSHDLKESSLASSFALPGDRDLDGLPRERILYNYLFLSDMEDSFIWKIHLFHCTGVDLTFFHIIFVLLFSAGNRIFPFLIAQRTNDASFPDMFLCTEKGCASDPCHSLVLIVFVSISA